MDNMNGMDDAPMPPMPASDDMNGEVPMGDIGENEPLGDEPMESPNEPSPTESSEDDELMNIIGNLSIEDKAAVIKYAKSMVDDSDEGEMPMESKRSIKGVIDEVINDVLNDREGTKRPEKKMPKAYRNIEMPFKSPF